MLTAAAGWTKRSARRMERCFLANTRPLGSRQVRWAGPSFLPNSAEGGIVMYTLAIKHLADTTMAKKGKAANEALFEEDYVLRSLGRIG
ncbi:hypothetical protein ABW43_06855 [Stenotrophomonas maltophilia]|uniref:Uncharacterized protein n=1 Tax=Stenotrophomonas maltophilia TaxID=40324 RepID=A0AAP7GUR8_STEMA|nr:hypothetical protein ABW43_06855 [Stenotrophomonas maltophilia]OBU63198.1 hypothetical protein A9K56_00325 [Stenotrophomonas maltophilia]